jgi:hypothetical protein
VFYSKFANNILVFSAIVGFFVHVGTGAGANSQGMAHK